MSNITYFWPKRSLAWVIFAGCFSVQTSVYAIAAPFLEPQLGVSLSSGFGAARIVPIRLGVQKEFTKRWCTESTWPIGGYWEGSLYSMRGKRGVAPNSHKALYAAALAGVFRFERAESLAKLWPYVELGIGLSYLSQREIGGRDLGIHFQFEDRLGIGFRFGDNRQYDLGYKAVHFSNAYIGPSNHGINLHIVTIAYWF